MNDNSYFEKVSEKLNKLTDEEFLDLLIESGLESCPYEDEVNVKTVK